MDKQHYEEAKIRLEEVARILRYEKISQEERERLEKEGRELARVLMTPWIPFAWGYRIVMLGIAFIGFWGLAKGSSYYALLWLPLPLFSPRIVGKFLSAITGFREKQDNR